MELGFVAPRASGINQADAAVDLFFICIIFFPGFCCFSFLVTTAESSAHDWFKYIVPGGRLGGFPTISFHVFRDRDRISCRICRSVVVLAQPAD